MLLETSTSTRRASSEVFVHFNKMIFVQSTSRNVWRDRNNRKHQHRQKDKFHQISGTICPILLSSCYFHQLHIVSSLDFNRLFELQHLVSVGYQKSPRRKRTSYTRITMQIYTKSSASIRDRILSVLFGWEGQMKRSKGEKGVSY